MNLKQYQRIQQIAKKTLIRLEDVISAEATENTIAEDAKDLLRKFGIPDIWYYNVPAFVLLGSRSCISISGREYVPSNEKVGDTNLITVDLSPRIGDVWGDCARSFVVENGIFTNSPQNIEFSDGLTVQRLLHKKMRRYVTPQISFSELFEYGNNLIEQHGYENLDFLSNLGHSIETKSENRRFIDSQCHELLGDVPFFTFEPHIKKIGGVWGFKHENIYYFNDQEKIDEL